MKSLSDFYHSNNYEECDKGTTHDYINGYYDSEFSHRKTEELKILEIGVFWGSSIDLWNKFFTNSTIYGIDISNLITHSYKNILIDKKVKLLFGDAYQDSILNIFPDDYFDYIIDDGPHTFESQSDIINKWIQKLKPNGKIIIEDIQSQTDSLRLNQIAREHYMVKRSTIIDLRLNKNRYDDIILEVVKK